MIYSLSINGADPIDAEANEVELLRREQHNQGVGHVTLMVRRTPDQAPLFAANDKVSIYRDGALWWTGWSGAVTKAYSGSDYGHIHVIEDPWRVCMESYWRGGYSDRQTYLSVSSECWRLLRVWQQAILADYFTMPPWPDAIAETTYDRWANINGPLSDSIINLLRTRLLAAVSFDHTYDPPVMQVTNVGQVLRTLHGEADGVTDVSLCRRDDLVPSAVELLGQGGEPFLGLMPDAYPLYQDFTENAFYPLDAKRGGWKCSTIMSPDLSFFETQQGMAKATLDLLSLRVWEGTFGIFDGACATGLYPGMTINLAGDGYDPEWTGLVIQSVSEDLYRGETTITVGKHGMPAATMIQQLHDMMRMRNWNFFQVPIWPGGGGGSAIVQPGAGTGAEVEVTADGNLSGTIRLVTGLTGIVGTDLVKVSYGAAISSGSSSVLLTATNGAAAALGASVTSSSVNRFIVGGGSVAAPGAAYTWSFEVTPT